MRPKTTVWYALYVIFACGDKWKKERRFLAGVLCVEVMCERYSYWIVFIFVGHNALNVLSGTNVFLSLSCRVGGIHTMKVFRFYP